MGYDFDLFIIGAGPAGLAAAKQAAQYGVRVAIAEQHHLGGCCVNRGCVPKKLMVYGADFAAAMEEASDYGWESCFSHFHWLSFLKKRDQKIQQLRQVQQQALEKAGVQSLQGHTRFLDAHRVQVNGQSYSAGHILIGVGGKPVKPDIPGIEHALTSDDLLTIEQLPRHIAILGGGYIGVELASILQGFGCQTTVMDRGACLLEGFDPDVQQAVREGLQQRGIQSFCRTTTDQITRTVEGFCLHLTGDCPETLVVDQVLCAVGRVPNLEGLGLEQAGVEFDQQAIAVDDHSRTTQSHIYAVGDCTNRKQLTPVARAEGQAAVHSMFGKSDSRLNYDFIPSAVLSRPEVASVGLTEPQAREQYGDTVECHRKTFMPLQYSLTEYQQPALLKLLVNQENNRLVGLHMVGNHAAEIVQSVAVHLQAGITYQKLMETIGIHPSIAEELFSP